MTSPFEGVTLPGAYRRNRYRTDDFYDVVEIGSGIGTSHEHTAIFERVVNTVVARRQGVPLCCNDSPETAPELWSTRHGQPVRWTQLQR